MNDFAKYTVDSLSLSWPNLSRGVLCSVICGVAITPAFLYLVAILDCDLWTRACSTFGRRPSSMRGRVVFITGASSGIGERLATDFARLGCKLVLASRRLEQLTRVQSKCIAAGAGKLTADDILVCPFDMVNTNCHPEIVTRVVEKFGRIDILVNNAGQSMRCRSSDFSLDLDKRIMDLNFMSQVSLTREVLPLMEKQRSGDVVVISSVSGKFGVGLQSTYCASKHALHGYFNSLRVESDASNIGFEIICPGPVVSNVQANAMTQTGSGSGVVLETMVQVSTQRCCELIMVAIANRISECWIAKQPTLSFLYLAQYCPMMISSKMLVRFQKARMAGIEDMLAKRH